MGLVAHIVAHFMNIRFYLGRKNAAGLTQIRIQITLQNDKFWIKTKQYVEAKFWNQRNQSHKFEEINGFLLAVRLKLSDIHRDAVIKQIPVTKEYVTNKYYERDHVLLRPTSDRKFIEWFEYFQQKHKGKMSKEHLRKFTQVRTHLVDYGISDFNEVSLDFYDNYVQYLSDKSLTNNTISKHIKCIVAICKDAEKEGLDIRKEYLDFKGMDYRVKPVWLKVEEIERANELKLTGSRKHIWDDWMFKYYTAIRNSDMDQIGPEHFIDRYIDFSSYKSRKMQKIPLHHKAYELAQSYDFRFPKYKLQYKNRIIKEICKEAEITDPIERVHFSSGKRIVNVLPKWKLVSSHTARRTFGRRFMESVGDIEKLREIYGHSSTDTTRIYIGWEPEEIASAVNSMIF